MRCWDVRRWPGWTLFLFNKLWQGFVGAIRFVWRFVFGIWRFVSTFWGNTFGFAWRFLRRMESPENISAIPQINRDFGLLKDTLEQFSSYDPDAPPLQTQNLRVVYPTRRWRDVARVVPSIRYAVGSRPVRGLTSIRDINLTVEPGLFGLLGPNGAGKTTLLRCLAGALKPTRGTVRIFGIPQREISKSLTPWIGYLPQNQRHFGFMTLAQYLHYFLYLSIRDLKNQNAYTWDRARIRRAIASAADEVNLLSNLNDRLSHFSGGMRQRAGLARVLLCAPPIVLVDEPTAGLDPVERVKVRLLLSQLAQKRAVIFSTHLIEDLEVSCQKVGILREGRLLYQGAPENLLENLQGQIWETPSVNGGLAPETLGRIQNRLTQVARADGLKWRCVASVPPAPNAIPVEPRLEDAFLTVLQSSSV